MSISHSRLDRFIAEQCCLRRKEVRLLLAQKKVKVDGTVVENMAMIINKFSRIVVDDKVIQANKPYYVMLHKPVGVVSATKDDKHQTVIDLIDKAYKEELHIVGRLDLNTSGLVLLTNDSRWSERLMSPENKVAKTYLVTLANPIDDSYVAAFAKGMYFEFEDITTLPAMLTVMSSHQAEVTLFEGKYHQIKRMFGRFRNPVVALHRLSIGNLTLTDDLSTGESRLLTDEEVQNI